ncbi:MAG: hypothetical protein KDE58_36625 [Caldilineaceae bacterium]|nr:hypothetical protein [Caldilineaceae bacterium]
MAQEKIAEGNYTGASHLLQEIVKHDATYKDAASMLAKVKQRKREQRNLLLTAILGASLFVGIGTVVQIPNDLIFILLAVIGAVGGFGVGSLFIGRQGKPATEDEVD